MSEAITCHCGEQYRDAECFVAHYRGCGRAARAIEQTAHQELLEIHRVTAHVAGVTELSGDETLTLSRVKQMAMMINDQAARAQGEGEAVAHLLYADDGRLFGATVLDVTVEQWRRAGRRLVPLYTHPSAGAVPDEVIQQKRAEALRQFRHNDDNSSNLMRPEKGFVVAYDKAIIDDLITMLTAAPTAPAVDVDEWLSRKIGDQYMPDDVLETCRDLLKDFAGTHPHNGEQAVEGGGVPVAWMKFRSFRIAADDVVEGPDLCNPGEVGDDGSPAFPVYTHPHNTEQGGEWTKCSDRLPTEADADFNGEVWVFDPYEPFPIILCETHEVPDPNVTHWKPTGLKRPEPPTTDQEKRDE